MGTLNQGIQTFQRLSIAVLSTAATGMFGAAWADPRQADFIGQPSTVSSTIQARVISTTPIMGQVAVPRRVCYDELRKEPPRSSGAGALLGAIAGGAVGNAVGKGSGNVLATGLGIFGGAILGDHIQNDGRQPRTYTQRRCEQQDALENRVIGYTVVYEYAGQRYSTQTGQEPGRTIPVQVTLAPLVTDIQQAYAPPTDNRWQEDDEDDDIKPARHRRRDWH